MGLIGNFYGFLGYYNHSRGKTDKAVELYEKAMEKGVTKPNFQMAYGVLLLRRGHFQEAKDIFSRLLVYHSTNDFIKTNSKLNLSLAYWKLGELDTAVEMLSEVHAKLRNSKTYGTLGYLLIETGDYDRALKFNLEAMDYDDTDSVVLDNIGQIYYRMGDVDKALEFFKKAEDERSDQADTLYYLGCIALQKGEMEKAEEFLERALSCNISSLSTISRKLIEDKLLELNKLKKQS